MNIYKLCKIGFVLLPILLTACGGDNDDSSTGNDNAAKILVLETRIDNFENRLNMLVDMNSDAETAVLEIREQLTPINARLESNNLTSQDLADIEASLLNIETELVALESSHFYSFQITVTNITHNQPLAPFAAILHDDSFSGWNIGQEASSGLEMLAESGSPAELLAEASTAFSTMAGQGVIPPGESVSTKFSAMLSSAEFAKGELALTIATMLVNTNDGFSGVTNWDLTQLPQGETWKVILPVYDAGTEANTESLSTVPGPAAGGEGFNPQRDDTANQVTRHPGVVTQANDYSESALGASHIFDQGAALLEIQRL